MKLEQLQLIYNLVSKYNSLKWLIKFEEVVLGKKITIIYSLQNFLTNYDPRYNCYGLKLDEVKMDKATSKFFDDVEAFSGVSMDRSQFLSDHMYDEGESSIEKEAKFFYDLKLTRENMQYLNGLFFVNGKLQSWKNVEKNYDPEVKLKTNTIKLNSEYTAILTKGKPVAVGCQRIPIEQIREIVKAYDEL